MKYSRSSEQAPGLGAFLKERIFKYVRLEVLSAVLLKIRLLFYEVALTGKYIYLIFIALQTK
jgi:hypothetical protein